MSNDSNVFEYMSAFSITAQRLQKEAKQAARRAAKEEAQERETRGAKKLKATVQDAKERDI